MLFLVFISASQLIFCFLNLNFWSFFNRIFRSSFCTVLGCPDEKIAYCGQETSFEFQSLKPTVKYTCRLQTSTEGDQSPISESVSFTMPESGMLWQWVICDQFSDNMRQF